jgi:TIR domain
MPAAVDVFGEARRHRPHWSTAVPAWDVFISHASEDKPDVVLPLAQALTRAGLTVWLDRHELKIGDSLHQKIDEGLANSSFGIVVVSPSFLAKRWPKLELDGLLTAEGVAGRKLILPVWHDIDRATLAKYSPILAGRLGGNTNDGIAGVAKQIIDIVTAPGSGAPVDAAPSPARRLIVLLDGNPSRDDIVEFLASYPALVHGPLGTESESDVWSAELDGTTIDLIASRTQHSTVEVVHSLVLFGPVMDPLIDHERPSPYITQLVDDMRRVRQWVGRNLASARSVVPDLSPSFTAVVVAGRRDRLSAEESALLRRFRDEVPPVAVRTYDWIIDAAGERRGS